MFNSKQSSRTPPPGFDRNQFEHILINFAGVRSSISSSPNPKLPKTGTVTAGNSTSIPIPLPPPLPPPSSSSSSSNGPPPTQHHLPLLATHSFLYNPVESCMFPIGIPPGFPSNSPDFMRLFAPNMAAVAAANATNPFRALVFVPNPNSSPRIYTKFSFNNSIKWHEHTARNQIFIICHHLPHHPLFLVINHRITVNDNIIHRTHISFNPIPIILINNDNHKRLIHNHSNITVQKLVTLVEILVILRSLVLNSIYPIPIILTVLEGNDTPVNPLRT